LILDSVVWLPYGFVMLFSCISKVTWIHCREDPCTFVGCIMSEA